MDDLKVRDVMTHLVVTLRESDTVAYAAAKLVTDRISGAPVVRDGLVVGVISEADLVRGYAPPRPRYLPSHAMMFLLGPPHQQRGLDARVSDVMTTEVITISPDATVWEAAEAIQRYGIRRLPVVDAEGSLLGIVARSDLIRAMADLGAARPHVVAGV